MNGKVVLTAGLVAVFAVSLLSASTMTFAQVYVGNVGEGGETGKHTLEENLELARAKVDIANANPGAGSGTPFLDPEGVIGASIIAGAVFGGVAGAFFVRARSGKYAAMGRG